MLAARRRGTVGDDGAQLRGPRVAWVAVQDLQQLADVDVLLGLRLAHHPAQRLLRLRRGDVEDRARRARDGDVLARPDVAPVELRAVGLDAVDPAAPGAGDDDLRVAVAAPSHQAEVRGGCIVAQHRSRAAGENCGGEEGSLRESGVAGGVDAAKHRVQVASGDAHPDRVVIDPASLQLARRDNAVLLGRQKRDLDVTARGAFVGLTPTKAPRTLSFGCNRGHQADRLAPSVTKPRPSATNRSANADGPPDGGPLANVGTCSRA